MNSRAAITFAFVALAAAQGKRAAADPAFIADAEFARR
jgi:hypothetical protein